MSVSGLGDEPGDLFPDLPPAEPPVCEHLWSSQHRPGHALYWVRQCMVCHEVDWDAIDAEVAGIVAAAKPVVESRLTYTGPGEGPLTITDEAVAALAEAGVVPVRQDDLQAVLAEGIVPEDARARLEQAALWNPGWDAGSPGDAQEAAS
jgi:hypothetical protein